MAEGHVVTDKSSEDLIATTSSDYYDYYHDDEAMRIFALADSINLYVKPILLITCFIGNSLCLIVLNSKSFTGFPQKHLLSFLAILDLLVAVIVFRDYLSAYFVPKNSILAIIIHNQSATSCKIVLYLFYLTTHLSAWTIVLITMERFVVTWFPLKFQNMCSPRKFLMAWPVILSIFVVLETPVLFITTHDGHAVDLYLCVFISSYWSEVWDYLDFFLMCIGPFLMISIFDTLIIFKLFKSSKKMQSKSDSKGQQGDKLKILTTMMLSICIVFLVTTLPAVIYNFSDKTFGNLSNMSRIDVAKETLVFVILDNIFFLNHTVNFIFYLLFGHKFRQAFKKVFLCHFTDQINHAPQTVSAKLSKST